MVFHHEGLHIGLLVLLVDLLNQAPAVWPTGIRGVANRGKGCGQPGEGVWPTGISGVAGVNNKSQATGGFHNACAILKKKEAKAKNQGLTREMGGLTPCAEDSGFWDM